MMMREKLGAAQHAKLQLSDAHSSWGDEPTSATTADDDTGQVCARGWARSHWRALAAVSTRVSAAERDRGRQMVVLVSPCLIFLLFNCVVITVITTIS